MKPADAVMWNIEVDPILRSTVTAVALLDQSPDWIEIRNRLDQAIGLVPRLRQYVEGPRTPFGFPRWVDDAQFDIGYHLRRVPVPDQGTMRAVLDLAAPITMEAFDPARPLWEFTLVEGLEKGRAALIQKFHHSIMDGGGAIALERQLLDRRDGAGEADQTRKDANEAARATPVGSPPRPTLVDALVEIGGRGRSLLGRGLDLQGSMAKSVWSAATDPLGAVRDGGRLARSIGKAVAPVPESASMLLRPRSLSRRLDTIDLLLEDLRAAAHARGGTVNDAFLAGVVGGLMKYHEHHGAAVDVLHLTMPVSVRVKTDATAGNRFAPVRFSVPADIKDPAERIERLGEIARGWQHEPFLQHTDTMAMALAWVVLDTAAVPDDACFMESLVAGFEEVIAVADHHARRTA